MTNQNTKPLSGPSKYAAFDRLIEGVQVIDRRGRYFYINEVAARQGKCSREELLGQSIRRKFPGIEKTEMFGLVRRCMTGKKPHHLINHFIFPDGSEGWFELSIQPVEEGVLILSYDITPQKKAEMELAKKLTERTEMYRQITMQKKQLEEFCQMIAHNLRAPLSNLLLLSDMVKESSSMEERLLYMDKQKPLIDFFNESFEELVEATIVRTDKTLKRDPVSLSRVFEKTKNLLQANIIQKNALVTSDFSGRPRIRFPSKYADSILFNLMSNALKYSDPNRLPRVHVRSYVKNGWVHLEVKDNGLGLDVTKHKNKLFKLRKTFHGNHDAKGFGLFITKTQIEAMGGQITLQSRPGKGSTFTVKLHSI